MPNTPVRERCLEDLKSRFDNRQEGVSGALLTWDNVIRQPIAERERQQNTVVSIMEGKETSKWVSSNMVEKMLPVSVEFEVRAYQGEDYAGYVNAVLADIQQTVGLGIGLGGCSLYMRETGNSVDIGGGVQRVIGGIVFYQLAYRHVAGDPTRAVGE